MNNMLNIVDELLKDGNYKKNNYEENKPDGVYLTNIDTITLKKSENTGTEWFNIVLSVLDGDYIEQKFYVSYFLSEKALKMSLSKIMKLISSLGYDPSVEMFADMETLEDALQTLVNSQVKLTKKTSKSGFVNYELDGEV